MKNIIFVFILVASACDNNSQKNDSQRYVEVDNKFCIRHCVKSEFEMFHNKGRSWGTGSSSMNGLEQKEIYNEVYRRCGEMMKGEKCCADSFVFGNNKTRRILNADSLIWYQICPDSTSPTRSSTENADPKNPKP
jgi:hypothetical protein